MTVRILIGDCRTELAKLPEQSVHCCVTSPPYFGLRDYGHAGQIGLEATPDAFVAEMVAVFHDVRRVLRNDGTLWLNLGDSYAGSNMTGGTNSKEHGRRADRMIQSRNKGTVPDGLKSKDLIGIPWRVAFALQADGWYLRQDIIWSKPNPMPESVTDRCTKAHEYLFLMSKSARYFYDAEAIKESSERAGEISGGGIKSSCNGIVAGRIDGQNLDRLGRQPIADTRNKRSVWTVATSPFAEAHFATFPPRLIEPCILAGCPKGGTVLDPFGGAGTTGLVADRLQRNSVLIELNLGYAAMAERRIHDDFPLFVEAAE